MLTLYNQDGGKIGQKRTHLKFKRKREKMRWLCFPGGSVCKESACNAGDLGLITGSGRSPGEGNSKLLRYSWKVPWTEEPGRLQSMESQRVRHD